MSGVDLLGGLGDKLGADIALARKKRSLTVVMMAERIASWMRTDPIA